MITIAFWLLILAALCLLGAIWQRRFEATVSQCFPVTGRMIEVNGRQVNVHASGEGSPTVVIDSGAGGCFEEWLHVFPAMAKMTCVVHIERPGTGFSDPAVRPHTAKTIALEHFATLDALGIEGPFVLVGNSLGGLHIRAMAHEKPDDIAGMVYVDGTHEVALEAMNLKRLTEILGSFIYVFAYLGEIGLLRILRKFGFGFAEFMLVTTSVKKMQADVNLERLRALYDRRISVWTAAKEIKATGTVAIEVAAMLEKAPLPDVPTVVLSAGEYPKSFEEGMKRCFKGHADLASSYSDGRHEIVKGAGHMIQVDSPERVIVAISEVIDKARAKQSAENKD